jgi:diguanylate cyclase (GGDEF)-like protein/PAS domain S-box-containing protein
MAFFLKSIGLVLACLVTAKLGLEFARTPNSLPIFWPPAGIALGVLLAGGPRYLGAVGVAAALSTQLIDTSPLLAIGFVMANLAGTWSAYQLLTRLPQHKLALTEVQDMLRITFVGGVLASLFSALVGVSFMWFVQTASTEALPSVMILWWRSNLLGIAFFTPLVLLFGKSRPFFSERITMLETVLLWLCAVVVGQMVFLGWLPAGLTLERPSDLVWIFPLIMWASLRTGRRNTVLVQLLFMLQALASAYLGVGMFADQFQGYGLTNFWFSALLLSQVGLSLAILSDERRRAMLKTSLHAKVFSLASDAVVIVNREDEIVSVNPAFTHITGFAASEVMGLKPRFYNAGDLNRAFYVDMWKTIRQTGTWSGEVWNRHKSGELFLEKLTVQTVLDANGQVVNRIGIFSDITESRAAQEAIAHQANHDFLTNLPNRLLFNDRFNQQLASARRNHAKFAVMYLDLDNFKNVNDTLGHAVGDQLLITMAQRLTDLVREIDTVCRLGGDEFVVLMSEVQHRGDVISLADKLLDTLAQPYQLGPHTLLVTASLGLAVYPHHGSNMDELLHAADQALYRAKKDGKNIWQSSVFSQLDVDLNDQTSQTKLFS